MTIAVAMSGGTDSLFALVLLKEQGQDVCGLHARFIPPVEGSDPVPAIREACERLGVALHVVDLTEAFEEHVVRPFIEDYMVGRTPNPCARCNAAMKFGLLADAAAAVGARRLATGHYARLVRHSEWGFALQRGVDPAKDQSYFLSLVPRHRLACAVFPLGNWRKEAVRDELAGRGIAPPLPTESQEICFVPGDDYRAFLKARNVHLSGPGPIVTTRGRKIGSHVGLWQYTEGQRKGLGIAWHEPLYVVGKDMENNVLLVGPREALDSRGCVAEDVNLLVPFEAWPADLLVRIRYRQQPLPAKVTLREGRLHVRFRDAQTPPARGQVLAVFDAEHHVLGGGVILGSTP